MYLFFSFVNVVSNFVAIFLKRIPSLLVLLVISNFALCVLASIIIISNVCSFINTDMISIDILGSFCSFSKNYLFID